MKIRISNGYALWHRIISRASPGVASRYTFESEPTAAQHPMSGNSLRCILAARRLIAAHGGEMRGYGALIEAYQQDEQFLHSFSIFFSRRARRLIIFFSSSEYGVFSSPKNINAILTAAISSLLSITSARCRRFSR